MCWNFGLNLLSHRRLLIFFYYFFLNSIKSARKWRSLCVCTYSALLDGIFLAGRGKTQSGSSKIKCSGECRAVKPHKLKLYVMMSGWHEHDVSSLKLIRLWETSMHPLPLLIYWRKRSTQMGSAASSWKCVESNTRDLVLWWEVWMSVCVQAPGVYSMSE